MIDGKPHAAVHFGVKQSLDVTQEVPSNWYDDGGMVKLGCNRLEFVFLDALCFDDDIWSPD